MNLREVGVLVSQRRTALGLTQDRLAKMAGLSRATINQLETGALVDLGATKLAALLDLLGLQLEANARPAPKRALMMASRTASVSYKSPLEATQLCQALATGELSTELVPHVASLLDEAPMSVLVAAVEEAARRSRVPPKRVWQHLLRWASDLNSPRPAWA